MKIISLTRNPKEIQFKDVEIGTVFKFGGRLYLKIDNKFDKEWNAVHLSFHHCVCNFNSTTYVEPKNYVLQEVLPNE